jgi:hypothetical protein
MYCLNRFKDFVKIWHNIRRLGQCWQEIKKNEQNFLKNQNTRRELVEERVYG